MEAIASTLLPHARTVQGNAARGTVCTKPCNKGSPYSSEDSIAAVSADLERSCRHLHCVSLPKARRPTRWRICRTGSAAEGLKDCPRVHTVRPVIETSHGRQERV